MKDKELRTQLRHLHIIDEDGWKTGEAAAAFGAYGGRQLLERLSDIERDLNMLIEALGMERYEEPAHTGFRKKRVKK